MPALHLRAAIAALVAAAALLSAAPALAGEAAVGVEDGASPDLVRFDTATPGTIVARVPVAGLSDGEQVVGLDVRPATGELWGLTSLDRLVKVDVETGQTQQLGTPLSSVSTDQDAGFDFDPAGGLLRIVTTGDEVVDVDPLTFSAVDPEGQLDTAGANVVATAYTSGGTLLGIGAFGDDLVQIAGTGELTTVGPLGVDVEGGGFDVIGASDVAFAALHSGAASSLYAVNRDSGQLSGIGAIAGERLGSFAMLPAGAVRTSTSSTAVSEAGGAATVTVERSGESLAPATVSYRTADQTAVAGQDYSAVAGTLAFAQGERSKVVSVPLLQDSTLEAPESFALVFGPTTGGVALDTREHAIRLLDDERSTIQIRVGADRTRPTFLFASDLPDHLRALGRARRLRLDVACSERCTVELSLKLGRTRIGAGSAKLGKAGVERATIRLTKAGRKAVTKASKARKRGRVALKLSGSATDAAGNVARRTATLRLARR